MKMHGRLAEIEAALESLGNSHPAEVDAFTNVMGKTEFGSALTSGGKEVSDVTLSVTSQCA